MPIAYQHVRKEERDLIAVMRSEGKPFREIARILGRDPGTISRELSRNAPPVHSGYYLPHKAQARAEERNRESHRRPRLKDARVRRYLARCIRKGWSPELSAGRLARRHPDWPTVTPEAIYQWIYTDRRDLIPHLARHHRQRFPRGHTRKHRKTHIPARISITKRPQHIATRRTPGHWESDTAISRASRAALQVSAERKTRLAKLAPLQAKKARAMSTALNRRLSRLPAYLRKTITYDNGSENVEHERTNAVLGTRSYFTEPYHSWEKGTVENTIGLVRRFLPKKTDFGTISNKELRKIEYWLNHRPRKCLDYRTPAEAFKDECCT